MKGTILALVILFLLVPALAHAACNDGKVDEGEQCDPKAKDVGCRSGYICAPSTCQCVIDYGSRSQGTTRKKVKVKR
jgi:hypothetical protein